MKGHYRNKPELSADHNTNDFNRYVTKMNTYKLRQRKMSSSKMINKGNGIIGRRRTA
jgi:hypothetical protein